MKQTKKIDKDIIEFLQHSNWIEGEYSDIALKDAEIAWKYAYSNIDNINVSVVLEIHRLLMSHLHPIIAGKIRNCDVWIGGQHKIFTSETQIEGALLMNVCFEMIAKGSFDKEAKTKYVHITFENIHPFVDGNGRVGRILYNIHRLKLGLPIHIIHQGDEQQEYYKWFK